MKDNLSEVINENIYYFLERKRQDAATEIIDAKSRLSRLNSDLERIYKIGEELGLDSLKRPNCERVFEEKLEEFLNFKIYLPEENFPDLSKEEREMNLIDFIYMINGKDTGREYKYYLSEIINKIDPALAAKFML